MGFNTKLLFAFSLMSSKILTSSHYTNYSIGNDNVCSVTKAFRELAVGKDNNSAIIVKDTYVFKSFLGKSEFDCKFTVKAKDQMGLFAVIQKMKLRKDLEKDDCIDYIQFKTVPRKKLRQLITYFHKGEREEEQREKKYCGEQDQFESHISEVPPPTPIALNAYIAKEGEMEVRIYIANRRIEPNTALEIEVAFTSFIECAKAPSSYKSCDEGYCIHKDYFSDNIVNCPFISCKDEPNCPRFVYDPDIEKGLDPKVYITAVSSIFFSFFLFLGCIMLCRYFDMLCWSEPPINTTAYAVELEQVSPTAPPLPESPDKDLPPAYETLFPGRE